MFIFACLLAATAAAPASYDQRQDGDYNVQAEIENLLFLVVYPTEVVSSVANMISTRNSAKQGKTNLQERSDVRVMEAFIEPSTPYHVEIGGSTDRFADGDGRAAEVVIAGRRHVESDPQKAEKESSQEDSNSDEELKLLGAMEQCGPDMERDPVTLICQESVSKSTKPEPSSVSQPALSSAPQSEPSSASQPEPLSVSQSEPSSVLHPESPSAPDPAPVEKKPEEPAVAAAAKKTLVVIPIASASP